MRDPDVFLTQDRVTEENLKKLSKDFLKTQEMRLCELAERARQLADAIAALVEEGATPNDALLSFSSSAATELPAQAPDGALSENEPRLGAYVNASSALDRAALVDLLTENLRERKIAPREEDFFEIPDLPERICYVKNVFAEEAYEVFSERFADPRVTYADTVSAAAQKVASGEVSYCILPIEERASVRLPTVTELLRRYDLRIADITPTFGPDGTSEMKYALVCPAVIPPPLSDTDDRYLEVNLPMASTAPADLFLAASFLGASPRFVNTATRRGGEESETALDVILMTEGKSFASLLTFFTLFLPDAEVVGIYSNLE